MLLSKIVETVNARLAGEMFAIEDIIPFLVAAVDDINTKLNTKFPVFSDLEVTATEYNYIPDKYIRTVVIPGAVFKFYTMDEEGAYVAPKYEEEFLQNLFYMERDYLMLVPEQFIADMTQGTYSFSDDHPISDTYRGLEFDVGSFKL